VKCWFQYCPSVLRLGGGKSLGEVSSSKPDEIPMRFRAKSCLISIYNILSTSHSMNKGLESSLLHRSITS